MNGLLNGLLQQAGRQVHDDALGIRVDARQPCLHKRNQHRFGVLVRIVWFQDEQVNGIGQAGTAIRSNRELKVRYRPQTCLSVKKGTPHKIPDEKRIRIQGGEIRFLYKKLTIPKLLRRRDRINAGEFQHKTARVTTPWTPTVLERDPGRLCCRVSGGRYTELTAFGENFRQIGKGFRQKLAATTLRTQKAGNRHPTLVCCRIKLYRFRIHSGVLLRGFLDLNDVQGKAVLELHAGRAQDGTQGTGRTPLFANDLPQIPRGHP